MENKWNGSNNRFINSHIRENVTPKMKLGFNALRMSIGGDTLTEKIWTNLFREASGNLLSSVILRNLIAAEKY